MVSYFTQLIDVTESLTIFIQLICVALVLRIDLIKITVESLLENINTLLATWMSS